MKCNERVFNCGSSQKSKCASHCCVFAPVQKSACYIIDVKEGEGIMFNGYFYFLAGAVKKRCIWHAYHVVLAWHKNVRFTVFPSQDYFIYMLGNQHKINGNSLIFLSHWVALVAPRITSLSV
mmetsp:Transcript_20780/g.70733  ORF Transcript_20780/g.70733 Transcript_20780/m.70733 type:complete len:122 (-) Transcript_20780:3145-3510(-)